MLADPLQLTICFCTRHRPVELERALQSVRASTVPVTQVIVSDDGADDETEQKVQQMFPEVTYLRGPRRGLGANRNCALARATGTHVLFMDDDTALASDFLAHILSAYEALPAEDRTRTILTGLEHLNGKVIEPGDLSFFGYVDKGRDAQSTTPLHTVIINAAVFPREAFKAIAFDENLVYGSDEVDICTQALAAGYRLQLCREAVNRHFHSPLHRGEYSEFTEASRLYTTHKRYRYLERAPVRAAAYTVLGPLHLLQAELRRRGLSGVSRAFRSMLIAARYARIYARAGQNAPPLRPSTH